MGHTMGVYIVGVLSYCVHSFRYIMSYFCVALLVTANASYGVYFKLDRWEQDDRNVYCLSDDHVQTTYSQKQLDRLAAFARERDARIIVEDMIDYKGDDERIARYLTQWHATANGKDVLVGITDYLCKQGVSRDKIDNVEFRQAAVVAIYSDIDLNVNDVMQPAYDEYHKGWSYQDGTVFNRYYKTKLQHYRQSILKPCRSLFWYMYWRKSRPLVQVLSHASYYKALDSVVASFHDDVNPVTSEEKLRYIILMHGTPLIDVKLVRALAQADERDVIICAGSGHINEVNEVLHDAGYQCVQSEVGRVRSKARHSNASCALDVRQMMPQTDPVMKAKRDVKKIQTATPPVSNVKQEKLDTFYVLLLGVFLLLAVLRYYVTRI